VRFHWEAQGEALWRAVRSGAYRLRAMQCWRTHEGEQVAMWDAQDALVLKYVALKISACLPVHPRCEHLKGHGGRKASLHRIAAALEHGLGDEVMQFVCRTDIRGYYQHIRKPMLMNLLMRHVDDPCLLSVLEQYVYYSVEVGGEFHTPLTGIPRGCALSPLLGGALLYHIDEHFSHYSGLLYARYMDDFLLLSPRRWPLRRAIRDLNDFFDRSGFEKHPDKTMIGRLSRGFDWLGRDFNDRGAQGVSARSLNKHRERCRRLYEQARRRGQSERAAQQRVAMYRARWRVTV